MRTAGQIWPGGRAATIIRYGIGGAALLLGNPSPASPPATGANIARGAYLSDIMGCDSCHSPWAGQRGPAGLVKGKRFSGRETFVKPAYIVTAGNITPDLETGIGHYTDAQLRAAIVDGVNADGVPMTRTMPSAYFRVLTRSDLNSLVAFVRSVPAVINSTPGPRYLRPVPETKVPGVSGPMRESDLREPRRRGFYIATLAHCVECHTPLAADGYTRMFATALGKGGTLYKSEEGSAFATNITSSKSHGLGSWTDAEIQRAITNGISRDGHHLKPPMGYAYYDRMSREDMAALIAWLRTLPPLD